jgi:hypothetical protein
MRKYLDLSVTAIIYVNKFLFINLLFLRKRLEITEFFDFLLVVVVDRMDLNLFKLGVPVIEYQMVFVANTQPISTLFFLATHIHCWLIRIIVL